MFFLYSKQSTFLQDTQAVEPTATEFWEYQMYQQAQREINQIHRGWAYIAAINNDSPNPIFALESLYIAD